MNFSIKLCSYDPNDGPELTFIDYLASAKSVNYAGHGYGAIFASSIYDRYWHPKITQDEAYDVLKKCVVEIQKRLVINLPNFNVSVVDKDGVKNLDPITAKSLAAEPAA